MPARPNTPANIWRHVYPDLNSGCWLWGGAPMMNGYGRLRMGDHVHLAHRYFYQVAHGPIPAGMSVLHSCDTPLCVNPGHLRTGTARDNAQDCVRRGRKAVQPGERNAQAKLTESAVADIRRRTWVGDVPVEIANDHGVSPSLVSKIKHGHIWRAAPDAA